MTVATALMHWSEEKFWDSTPRKFIAIRNEFMRIDNQKLKLILRAINPDIEFEENDEEAQEGVYIDQIGF